MKERGAPEFYTIFALGCIEFPFKSWEQFGNRTCQIPPKIIKHDAERCLTNRLLRFSGVVSGFQVRLLGGSSLSLLHLWKLRLEP